MEIEYLGGGTISLSTKKATFIVDPIRSDTNLKPALKSGAIYIATQLNQVPEASDELVIDSPGEFEASEVSIVGVSARNMLANDNAFQENTVYKLTTAEASIVIIGNIDGPLSESQLEELGMSEIAIIPVGGGGFTLDAKDAAQVVKQLEVKAVIPVHYHESGVTYEVPQDDLDLFITEVGGQAEELPKLKLKNWQVPATMTIYTLASK
jgi:L-ascorbate metabolism protein UlaG (beta-lactamase superfamily)